MDVLSKHLNIIGPCSLESAEQVTRVMDTALDIGIQYIRAQVYKPRTSPGSFKGMGSEGIQILKELKKNEKYQEIKYVCEVCSKEHFDSLKDLASIIQIGARNMQNFELLKYVAQNFNAQEYVLLKRGFANNLKEWISAAEYLVQGGIPKEKIILCERGSRSFTSPTGVSLDFIAAFAAQSQGFHVIIDPSHGSKDRKYVLPLAQGALAMNFDGVMIEVHPTPEKSISDKDQAISLEAIKTFFHD